MAFRNPYILTLACLGVGLSLAAVSALMPDRHTNLVLIVVDTMRADAISGSAGSARTPHMDRLAAEGVLFSQAFAHAPLTLPSHAAMFSSRVPFQAKVTNNGLTIDEELPLLAEHLSGRGYHTAAAVSLATLWPGFQGEGLDRGFDVYDLGRHEIEAAEQVSARLDKLLGGIGENQPFFLFAHFSDPHEPYDDHGPVQHTTTVELDGKALDVVPTSRMTYWDHALSVGPGEHLLTFRSEDPFKLRRFSVGGEGRALKVRLVDYEYMRTTTEATLRLVNNTGRELTTTLNAWVNDAPEQAEIRERYRQEVEAVDAAIGKLIADLKRRHVYENTLIVLTSDHGEALGEHGCIGHAVNLYDELLRVPLIIRPTTPEQREELAQWRHHLVRHVDYAPTLLELMGEGCLEGATGRSILDGGLRLLLAETHPPEAPHHLYSVRDDKYKLVYDATEGEFEMYRLGPDPLELDNVFAHQGHLRADWQQKLRLIHEREPAEDVERRDAHLRALGYGGD